jgi:hypothetical protein
MVQFFQSHMSHKLVLCRQSLPLLNINLVCSLERLVKLQILLSLCFCNVPNAIALCLRMRYFTVQRSMVPFQLDLKL